MHAWRLHCRGTAYYTEDAEAVLRLVKLRDSKRFVLVCHSETFY